MKAPVPEFFKALAVTVTGTGLSLRELLTNGSLLMTFAGAALAILGGYWAYRTKRTEHQIKEIELRIKQSELDGLRWRGGSGSEL